MQFLNVGNTKAEQKFESEGRNNYNKVEIWAPNSKQKNSNLKNIVKDRNIIGRFNTSILPAVSPHDDVKVSIFKWLNSGVCWKKLIQLILKQMIWTGNLNISPKYVGKATEIISFIMFWVLGLNSLNPFYYSCSSNLSLTLIWVGFLEVRLEAGVGRGREVKLPPRPCLKLVRIVLETSKLARNYTPIVVAENIAFSAWALLILLMSAFFCKKFSFLSKKSTFTQCNSLRAVLGIF